MLEAFFLALISALVGYGFSKTLGPDMIFNFYHKFISKLSRRNKFLLYIAKPLGLCLYCNTFWISVIMAWYTGCDFIWVIACGVTSIGMVSIISLYFVMLTEKIRQYDDR